MFPRRCWFVSIYCAGISSPATATGRRSAISVSAVSPLLHQPGSNFLGSKNSGSMGPGHHRARAHTRGRVLGFLCIILLCYVERPERGEPCPCHVIQMCREKIYLQGVHINCQKEIRSEGHKNVPNQILILCMFFSTSSHFVWLY